MWILVDMEQRNNDFDGQVMSCQDSSFILENVYSWISLVDCGLHLSFLIRYS